MYADELFWRTQMRWCLPDRDRIRVGLHPDDWDGRPVLLEPGVPLLKRVEPIWRQMRLLRPPVHSPEEIATRTVELLAKWTRLVAPTFLSPGIGRWPDVPLSCLHKGLETDHPIEIDHVARAVRLLQVRLSEPWTVSALAREVAVSRTHLTRLFVLHVGEPPMRFLTEMRLAKFARLIDESGVPVGFAARSVGWQDPRVASKWFRRRFGVTPTEYRSSPRPLPNNGNLTGAPMMRDCPEFGRRLTCEDSSSLE